MEIDCGLKDAIDVVARDTVIANVEKADLVARRGDLGRHGPSRSRTPARDGSRSTTGTSEEASSRTIGSIELSYGSANNSSSRRYCAAHLVKRSFSLS